MKALKKDSVQNRNTPLKLIDKHEAAEDHDHDHGHDMMGGGGKKAEEGEGPWLVSYADMMTLLMGFFALIASFSKPNAKEFDKVAASASQYFGAHYEAPYEKLGRSILKVVKENKLDDKVQVEVNSEGVALTFNGTMFFDSGNYTIKNEAVDLLEKLVTTIRKDAVPYKAMIEGHTDNAPIHQEVIASNWELSAIRAARIAEYFETRGFQKDQLTIMGWGETRPVAPNLKTDGSPDPVNQSKNRRVVIRIYKELPK